MIDPGWHNCVFMKDRSVSGHGLASRATSIRKKVGISALAKGDPTILGIDPHNRSGCCEPKLRDTSSAYDSRTSRGIGLILQSKLVKTDISEESF